MNRVIDANWLINLSVWQLSIGLKYRFEQDLKLIFTLIDIYNYYRCPAVIIPILSDYLKRISFAWKRDSKTFS